MKDQINRNYYLTARILATCVVLVVLFFLLNKALVPSGVFMAGTDFVSPAPFFSVLKPTDRVVFLSGGNSGAGVSVTGHPVYVDFTPPAEFDTVTLTLVYGNSGHPFVELGALGSAIDDQFDVRPVENLFLDALPWSRISSGRLSLIQRSREYSSLDEFFRDPPERSRLAVYKAAPPEHFVMDGYAPMPGSREFDVSLRGSHRMLTYVKDEPLSFTFLVQDMNREEGADPVTVSVYREGDMEHAVARTVLSDDGNVYDDQASSGLRSVSVTFADPDEGVYQVEFTAPDDIFIRKIQTRQHKAVFVRSVCLGDHVGFSDTTDPVIFYGDGRRFEAKTSHEGSLQILIVGTEELVIGEPNTRYVATLPGIRRLVAVTSPGRDVSMETDGLFSLTRDSYFNPLPLSLTWYIESGDLDEAGIDFILTEYEAPERKGDEVVAKIVFDASKLAKTEDGAYRFAFAVPGIDETRYELDLRSLEITLRREPVTLRNAASRLRELFLQGNLKDTGAVLPGGTTYGESPE